MNLIKYTNFTNPNAHIVGVFLLTDELLKTFNANIEAIKTALGTNKLFLVPVGEGYILIDSTDKLELSYTITQVKDSDLSVLESYGIGNLGFAPYFVDAVLNVSESNFTVIPQTTETNPIPM